jgi:diguanylate cyclase (GGDEF)-like protein
MHEQELVSFAHYDPLTGMPNRRLFFDRLKQALARAKRSGKPLAVGYIDLDSFKPINDRFGHMAGDQVLIEITGRVQNLLRAEDTIARIGGDEFVLLLADLNEIDGYTAILDRVLTAISAPIQIEGILVSISASIGVAVAPPAEYEAEILVKRADQAMYEAKLAGKNRYQVFAESSDRDS